MRNEQCCQKQQLCHRAAPSSRRGGGQADAEHRPRLRPEQVVARQASVPRISYPQPTAHTRPRGDMSDPSPLWYGLLIGVVVLSWLSRLVESNAPRGLEEGVSVAAVASFVAMEYLHWQAASYILLLGATTLFVFALSQRLRHSRSKDEE